MEINTWRCTEDGTRPFLVVPSDKTTGNGHHLTHRFSPCKNLGMLFPVRVTVQWHNFPRAIV